jgi:DNA-binding transcriptional MerR regulator
VSADPVDAALIEALTSTAGAPTEPGLTVDELADRSGLPPTVVEAVAREGLLHPMPGQEPPRFTEDDLAVLRAGTTLLEAGLPLGELLDLARRTDQTMRELADHAVDVFLRFVRDPVRGTADDADEAAAALVGAFRSMLPASGELVGAHFRRLLVAAARARVEDRAPDEAP